MSKTIIAGSETVIAQDEDRGIVQGTVIAGGTIVAGGTVVANGTVVSPSGEPKPSSPLPKRKSADPSRFRLTPGAKITLSGKDYTIEKGVSSGTEAELYVVTSSGKRYAAKLYNAGYKPNDKVLPDVMTITNDPHIVTIHQSGMAEVSGERLSYTLMEYCEAGATSNYSYRSDVGSLLAIALQGAQALDLCHRNKILHKDIKPANILVRKRFPIEVCICDFGIADKLDKEDILTSQSRTRIYAAPEVYKTGNIIDGRTYCKMTAASDYYSLGMSLMCLWVGEEEFSNKSEIELAYQKQEESLPMPGNMPAQLKKIISWLTQSDPKKRWGLAEIERYLSETVEPLANNEEHKGILYDITRNQVVRDRAELAEYLQTYPSLGQNLLYRGRLGEIVRKVDPELQQDLTQITEVEYRNDKKAGLSAAIFAIDPDTPILLVSTDGAKAKANTVSELVGFCCTHKDLSENTLDYMLSSTFVRWLKARDAGMGKKVADLQKLQPDLPEELRIEFIYRLIIQTLEPFADLNLCADPKHAHYAMTGEGIAWYINEVFNVYFSLFGGDETKMTHNWSDKRNGLRNVCSSKFACLVVRSFDKGMTSHKSSYLIASLRTKGNRFDEQVKWINYCTDNEPTEGPKYNVETAMMKAAMGLGLIPTYHFYDSGRIVKTVSDLGKIPAAEAKQQLDCGLRGWIAVQFQDNVNLDDSEPQAYEKQLHNYLETIGKIDPADTRFLAFKICKDRLESEAAALGRYPFSKLTKIAKGGRILQKVFLFFFIPATIILALRASLLNPSYFSFYPIPGWMPQVVMLGCFIFLSIDIRSVRRNILKWEFVSLDNLVLAPIQQAYNGKPSGPANPEDRKNPVAIVREFVRICIATLLVLVCTVLWYIIIFNMTGWFY